MDSKQINAAREDLDVIMEQMRGYPPSRVAAVVWDWMGAQGFRDEAHTPVRCDYCGDELLSVKKRADVPTTPDLQRLGFDPEKVVCPECVEKAHTPTDDEREADEKAILNALYDSREAFTGVGAEVGTDETAILVDHVPEIVLSLGFHRSVVPEPTCLVAWGTHACRLPALHTEPCRCCCTCTDHLAESDENGCVGAAPYYGPETTFSNAPVPAQTLAAVHIEPPRGEPSDAQVAVDEKSSTCGARYPHTMIDRPDCILDADHQGKHRNRNDESWWEPQREPSDAQVAVTPEMVEAGAREAFFTDDAGGHIRGGHTWSTIPEVGRENYRTMVRGVLHAALAVTEQGENR